MEYQGIDSSTAQYRCRPDSVRVAFDEQTPATLRDLTTGSRGFTEDYSEAFGS
jgi:hypothetical protein